MLKIRHRAYNNKSRPELKWVIHVPPDLLSVAGAKHKYFRTEDDAKTYGQWLTTEAVKTFAGHRVMPEELRVDAFRAFDHLQAKLGPGHSILTAVIDYCTRQAVAAKTITCAELATKYTASLKSLDKDAKTAKTRLGRFNREFGEQNIHEVTAEAVASWLAGLEVSATTKNGLRTYVSCAFEYARRDLKLIETNPIADVRTVQVKLPPVEILTVLNFRHLLKAAMTDGEDEMMLWFLIGGFAGLRPSELERLRWSDIHMEDANPEIAVDTADTRSYAHRYVPIHPTLLGWLKQFSNRSGLVIPHTVTELRRCRYYAMHKAAIQDWPTDAMRHSYGSYYLADTGDLKNLARNMGHANTKMIEKHYRRRVKAHVAKEWWETTEAVVKKTELPPPPDWPVQFTNWGKAVPIQYDQEDIEECNRIGKALMRQNVEGL